jgi:hypothetical protein
MNLEDKELNIISQILELKDLGVSDAEILAKMEKECPQSRGCLELIQKLKKERETCCPDKNLLKFFSRAHLKITIPATALALMIIGLILVNQKQSSTNVVTQNPATEIQSLTTALINEATTEKSTIQAAKNDVQLININDTNLQDLGQFPYDIRF